VGSLKRQIRIENFLQFTRELINCENPGEKLDTLAELLKKYTICYLLPNTCREGVWAGSYLFGHGTSDVLPGMLWYLSSTRKRRLRAGTFQIGQAFFQIKGGFP
jgi:hypothetical protein